MVRDQFKTYSLSGNKPKIYALCDYATLNERGRTLEDFIDRCRSLKVSLVQYRDKISDIEQQKRHLFQLKEKLSCPVIINDHIELVPFADGLHLGQEDLISFYPSSRDLAISFVRKKMGTKLLGLSTHNEKEVLQANQWDIDYIGLGAYAATSTKQVQTVLGDTLSYLARMSSHPVCAIGGVKLTDSIDHVEYLTIGSGLFS